MTTLNLNRRFAWQFKIRETLVETLKIVLVVKPVQFLFGRKRYSRKLEAMRNYSPGSVAHELASLLESKGLKLIPVFEEHDLKHLLLGYGMSPIEEIRMQAYLCGNGNYSPFSLLFLASGLIFPEAWSVFRADYKLGKRAPSILKLKLADSLPVSLEELRAAYTI